MYRPKESTKKPKVITRRFVLEFTYKIRQTIKTEPVDEQQWQQQQQQPQDEKQQPQDENHQQPQDEKQQHAQNATGKKRGRKRKNEAAEGAFFILSATIEIQSTLYMYLRMNKSESLNLLFLFHREP